jgi:hypothetical protein
VSFEQIKREVALLDERQQTELISYTLQLRYAHDAGSAPAVRQTMRSAPHLTADDVTILETAIERGEIPVSEPWVFNDRKQG